jgi:hypothetical protein
LLWAGQPKVGPGSGVIFRSVRGRRGQFRHFPAKVLKGRRFLRNPAAALRYKTQFIANKSRYIANKLRFIADIFRFIRNKSRWITNKSRWIQPQSRLIANISRLIQPQLRWITNKSRLLQPQSRWITNQTLWMLNILRPLTQPKLWISHLWPLLRQQTREFRQQPRLRPEPGRRRAELARAGPPKWRRLGPLAPWVVQFICPWFPSPAFLRRRICLLRPGKIFLAESLA